MNIFVVKDDENKELGVITAENGFVIIIKDELHGPFPYSMKEEIMNLFRNQVNA